MLVLYSSVALVKYSRHLKDLNYIKKGEFAFPIYGCEAFITALLQSDFYLVFTK